MLHENEGGPQEELTPESLMAGIDDLIEDKELSKEKALEFLGKFQEHENNEIQKEVDLAIEAISHFSSPAITVLKKMKERLKR